MRVLNPINKDVLPAPSPGGRLVPLPVRRCEVIFASALSAFPRSLHRAYSSDASHDREGVVSRTRTTSAGQSARPEGFLAIFRRAAPPALAVEPQSCSRLEAR